MGSYCLNKENNSNIEQKNQVIKLYGFSDETHDINVPIFEDNSEYLQTKQQISKINENINNNNKIKISSVPTEMLFEPTQKDEIDYEMSYIKESDKENNLLKKLYNILEDKGENSKKNDVIIKYNNGEKYFGEWDIEKHKNGRGIQIFNNKLTIPV